MKCAADVALWSETTWARSQTLLALSKTKFHEENQKVESNKKSNLDEKVSGSAISFYVFVSYQPSSSVSYEPFRIILIYYFHDKKAPNASRLCLFFWFEQGGSLVLFFFQIALFRLLNLRRSPLLDPFALFLYFCRQTETQSDEGCKLAALPRPLCWEKKATIVFRSLSTLRDLFAIKGGRKCRDKMYASTWLVAFSLGRRNTRRKTFSLARENVLSAREPFPTTCWSFHSQLNVNRRFSRGFSDFPSHIFSHAERASRRAFGDEKRLWFSPEASVNRRTSERSHGGKEKLFASLKLCFFVCKLKKLLRKKGLLMTAADKNKSQIGL